MRNLEALILEALHLPTQERARLAERLLESLSELSQEEIERLWAREAIRRVEDYEAGRISSHPANEVHEEIRRRNP